MFVLNPHLCIKRKNKVKEEMVYDGPRPTWLTDRAPASPRIFLIYVVIGRPRDVVAACSGTVSCETVVELRTGASSRRLSVGLS